MINKLPSCIILHEAGSFLKLVNVRTGLTVGHHGKFDNSKTGRGVKTDAQWDFGTYPKLKTSFAGLYRCRTDTANSTQSYLLNVTGETFDFVIALIVRSTLALTCIAWELFPRDRALILYVTSLSLMKYMYNIKTNGLQAILTLLSVENSTR